MPKWSLQRSRLLVLFSHSWTRDVKLHTWNLRQACACTQEIIIFPKKKSHWSFSVTPQQWPGWWERNRQNHPGCSQETADQKDMDTWEQSEHRAHLCLQHISSLLSAPRSWLRASRKCLPHVPPCPLTAHGFQCSPESTASWGGVETESELRVRLLISRKLRLAWILRITDSRVY